MFDPKVWGALPFHFWTVVFFGFGCTVGSFLNVCIYRMPLGLSVVSPPSHCPHCKYSIPWFLNVPLATWLWLKGKCANCGAPISIRYFMVELLTGLMFAASWLHFGAVLPGNAVAYCVLFAGFITATFIDLEHFIIPDEITFGGIAVGFLLSLAFPGLQGTDNHARALEECFKGIVVGGGLVYAILRLGKLAFGRQKVALGQSATVIFGEAGLHLPDSILPYEDIFYRQSDTIRLIAQRAELADRCYWNVPVRLSPKSLQIGEDKFSPEETHFLEVTTEEIVLPREAMGLGDVKFMAAIGAFVGWEGTVFSLMASSIIGSAVGVVGIVAKRRDWSSRVPYGPYIALAATIYVFFGGAIMRMFFSPIP